MKSYTGFQLVSKLMTLNDLEQRNESRRAPAVLLVIIIIIIIIIIILY